MSSTRAIPPVDAFGLARSLAHLPGLVCFDDPVAAGRWRGEWVAAAPDLVVRGHLGRMSPPVPTDGEFWAGTIDYDGTWQFARYPAWLHRAGPAAPWQHHGVLPAAMLPPHPLVPREDWPAARWSEGADAATYGSMVRRAQEYIAAGDIYQVNLAHRFSACWDEPPDAMSLYAGLREVSPAPHAAFLDQGVRTVLSASPETLLDRDGDQLVTRPIKGTRPRAADPQQDEDERRALVESPKERAELVMITDLERNDLGRVVATGSVVVDKLCALESFAQVHHLVSHVSGTLRPVTGWPEIWPAMLPGGSITGAPKLRAMEIIRELEADTRGLYTGAIGWMLGPDRGCFAVAIRTAVVRRSLLEFHVGAGIVEGSVAEAEYAETHHKAAGLLQAFRG